MLRKKLYHFFTFNIWLLCLLFITQKVCAQTCTEVIGYYPNWQWYDRGQLVKPTTIQYSKYSIINYAFFKPETDGSITSTDAWADQNLLLGQINWSAPPNTYYPNTSIIDLAHNAGTKVLPSIGGWTLSNNFSSIAASATKRNNFAHGCCELIRTYQFDGIDIDWEYPGYAPNSGTINDKINFTIFLQQIRDSLTTLGLQNNKNYMLTICIGASRQNMLEVEWNNITNIVDIINLMSYDFFGSWDAVANHNSPLHKPLQGDPTFNLDSAVTYLLDHYQLPPNKLAAGLAFYGRSAKTSSTPLLFSSITGVDNITFSADDGTPLYYNIVAKQNLFTRHWDPNAQVPYLLGNGSLHTFVSYDDKESIALKANYIKNKNLRGVIIWEITGDYLETSLGSGIISGTPLLDTLNTVFCNSISPGCNPPNSVSAVSSINSLTLSWLSNTADSFNVHYKKLTDSNWNSLITTSSSILLSGLICNTQYQVKISSFCATTSSAFGSIQTFNTLLCSTPCVTPNGIIVSPSISSATINWPNTGALSYHIEYKMQSNPSWNSLSSTTNSIILNGLTSNTNYEVRVQSVCSSSNSAYSIVTNFTTSNATITNCNYPLWNASNVYLSGDSVRYNDTIYKAKYWTQNNIPSFNYGNCCVWDLVMPCGGYQAITCFKPAWNPLIAYSGGDQVYLNGSIYQAQWWTLNQNPASNSSAGAVWQLVTNAICQVSLNLEVFIQGYYLGSGNMIINDSLLVELHEDIAANQFPLVASYHGILTQSGHINCIFPASVYGKNCYIVLKHRNALLTWSADPITISAITNYDFTTAANKAYGSNQIEVENGIWAIYSGELNADENIDLLDLNTIEMDISNFQFGYLPTDINGDSNIDLLDIPIVESNINHFIFTIRP
ncbi:MAG TPA: glycosyl hydrolase family 18 protein [Chitinophagaceae bacterium]|nr:glycosyl hydrolase family 18 protein [Chitinophagaceae bacterium]